MEEPVSSRQESSAKGMIENSAKLDVGEGRKTELQSTIAAKKQEAESLRKTVKAKFEEFKKMKKEFDDEQATTLRLKIAGKLNLSDKDLQESKRFGQDNLEAVGRDIDNYRRDADDLDKEIAELNAELNQDQSN